jgi:hypothetical protein
VAEFNSPELAELSILVRERNAIEVRIARMLDRPISVGDTLERGAVLIPARASVSDVHTLGLNV